LRSLKRSAGLWGYDIKTIVDAKCRHWDMPCASSINKENSVRNGICDKRWQDVE